ncbi:MAG: ABC transporter ATP-binding protein, partial [Planctomycetes bacterium]|nr:ABC transporter ATP-binding protein [Planctomycetota bacterium]
VVGMGRRPYLGRWGIMEEEDRRAVREALAAVHIEHLADRPVTALSGGERRRCIVARALAQSTPILLLDEPSAGLDIAQALSVMALAKSLAGAGRLVVTVSHDLDTAAAYADELVFLNNGKLIAAGSLAEVFTGEILSRVYGTEARVEWDDFSSSLAASFRLPS